MEGGSCGTPVAPLRIFDEIAGLRWLKTVSSIFQDVDFDGS